MFYRQCIFAVCILKKYQESNKSREEKNIAEHALREQFTKAQIAIEGLYQNLFGCFGKLITWPFAIFASLNKFTCPANDNLGHKVAKNFIKNSDIRNELTDGIFVPQNKTDALGRIENALALH